VQIASIGRIEEWISIAWRDLETFRIITMKKRQSHKLSGRRVSRTTLLAIGLPSYRLGLQILLVLSDICMPGVRECSGPGIARLDHVPIFICDPHVAVEGLRRISAAMMCWGAACRKRNSHFTGAQRGRERTCVTSACTAPWSST
jgi:hypothetical protein